MAKFENLADSIFIKATENNQSPYDIPWENLTGMSVEDFVTRKLASGNISSMSYENSKLTLVKDDGTTVETTVTVETPTYDFGVYVYGLRITDANGKATTYTSQNSTVLTQYTAGKVYELGVAIYATSSTSVSVSDRVGSVKTKVSYGSRSKLLKITNIPYADCILDSNGNVSGVVGTADEIVNKIAWVDISDLFAYAQSNMQITAQIQEEGFTDKKHTLSSKITTEVLKLTYAGQYVNKSKTAAFNLTGGSGTYELEVYINGTKKTDVPQGMSYPNLVPGLNQMIVRAVNTADRNIYTDWLFLDIICTVDCNTTAVAINGVRSSIDNNGVATLYDIKVYSPNKDNLELTTYLETKRPGSTPQPTLKLKYEVIGASSYNSDNIYETSYLKYIELSGSNNEMYLLINTDGKYYEFPTISAAGRVSTNKFKQMVVQELDTNLAYYSGVKPEFNFDLITGAMNNVFITKDYAGGGEYNISDTLEPSNGWYEENGRTLFRLTAQKDPIFKAPINLGLSNNCTIELGFKTKNISNKNKPIMTLGNLLLRPTLICWWTNSMKEEELEIPGSDTLKAFSERNSQFREGAETHVVITLESNWKVDPNGVYSPKDILPSDELKSKYENAVNSAAGKQLAKIYINGVIDREFLFDDTTELNTLVASSMQMNPTTADIDFYLFRTYSNTVLDSEKVQLNYMSFLANKADKLAFFDKNDIVGDNGEISYLMCQGKYNTLLLIMPNFLRVPNFTWKIDDPTDTDLYPNYKKKGSTLFINYADEAINQQYGGRLNHGQIKGQGSSAKRYLWWNSQFALNKFKKKVVDEAGLPVIDPETGELKEVKIKSEFLPYSTMNPDTHTFNPDAEPTKGYYHMPPYEGQVDQTPMDYTKMVGKINFASSMQSHKQGACKLFDDAYKSAFGSGVLYSGGRKAVHEEAFLYFYWETDMEDVSKIEFADVMANYDKIKFAGFLTWGPGKGDDACSGYDEDLTPEYLMLEGGENSDSSVNFRVPWMALQRGDAANYATVNYKLTDFPTVTAEESLDQPWKNLLIDDESVVYASRGAWDIDYGCVELKTESKFVYFEFDGDYDEKTKEATRAKKSLKTFRDFYDTVYKYFYNYVIDEDATAPTDAWNTKKGRLQRYVVTSGDFSIDGKPVTDHQSGDMYRFEEYSEKWVKAGLYYDKNKASAENPGGGWERLNIFDLGYELGEEQLEFIRDVMKEKFKEEVSKFLDLDDIAFHQAFIKFMSGTDNRAKNTYFQIIGPHYEAVKGENGEETLVLKDRWDTKIRLIGDDLDTIMVTDNNGLLSKPYNLLESSYAPEMDSYWGDANNIFFQMFDQCFEDRIKTGLNKILEKCNIQRGDILSPLSYFYKAFFSIQETYPAVAYNHTAKLWYDNAQSVLDAGVLSGYNNNNIDKPVSQSHGSCLQCEAQFMKERYDFLNSYAQNLTVNDIDMNTYAGSGGEPAEMVLRLEFEPYQDFYPGYYADRVQYYQLRDEEGNPIESEYDTIKYLTKTGKKYVTEINTSSTNQGIFFINLYKSLNILGLGTSGLSLKGERLTELTIDNSEMVNYPIFANRPPSSFSGVTAQLPVLENLALRNVTLGDTVNCSEYVKLLTIDLSGSTTNQVIFPETGTLQTVTIPAVKIFKIYNNPGLLEVNIADTNNIEEVYIDCSKCGAFDVAAFLESLSKCDLKSVDIRNANNLKLTEEIVNHLLGCEFNITGTIKIIERVGSENLKDIAFATKQALVNKFGNIDDPNIADNSKLYVEYKHSDVTSISGPGEVSVFGTLNKPIAGLFPVTIALGNKVTILNGANPFDSNVDGYLDISYEITKLSGTDVLANVASIPNSRNGYLIVKKESEDFVAKVTVKVTVENSVVPLTHDIIVRFAWKAPQVGDFAYIDGSFSSAYDSNKTLVGIVYAASRESDVSGKVYIMGKEYTSDKKYYLGYADESSKVGTSSDILNLQKVNTYLTGLGLTTDYDDITSIQKRNSLSTHLTTTIEGGYYDDYSETQYDGRSLSFFYGKEDTADYVNHVNTVLLPKLSIAREYVKQSETGVWHIPSMENLNKLYDLLPTMSGVTASGSTQPLSMISALLFPYFYSSYLYEPKANSGEVINEQYKQGNWYTPSAAELARIAYYSGYSIAGSDFAYNRIHQDHSDNIVIDGGGNSIKHTSDYDPSSIINVGDGDFNIPIFSLAYDRMNADLNNTVWYKPFTNVDNTCTTTDATSENYSYQIFSDYGSTPQALWTVGDYNTSSYGHAVRNAWRFTEHSCIPHVQFNYAKP